MDLQPSKRIHLRAVGRWLGAACVLLGAAWARADLNLSKDATEIVFSEGLTISDVASWGRRAINLDAVAELMARGTFGAPREGDTIKRPEGMGGVTGVGGAANGERTWKGLKASEKGEFAGLGTGRGTYVLCMVNSDRERVMLLEASGHTMVYVNTEPHAGDPYSHGYVRIPVLLRKGENQFVFAYAGRGPLKSRLADPPAEVFANTSDLTLPDVLSDKAEEYLLAAPIVNASVRERRMLVSVQPEVEGGWDGPVREERVTLPPLSVRKIGLHAMLGKIKDRTVVEPTIIVRDEGAAGEKRAEVSRAGIKLQAKSSGGPHCRTFVSEIDGSVQYCAITPPCKDADGKMMEHPGLVLSLHGAGVEAAGQAPCYSPKPDFVVVCPTNRRPYGFDWEDWGRVDAIEVMDHAREWYKTDPRKQYLTGHSMGGHGAWQLGVLLTDRFAGVAPSAGWLSFDTYAGVRGEATETTETRLREMFRRASSSSDTLALMPNLKSTSVYILHGDADDNVPVTEARRARDELTKLGIEFGYHEQPGAGHWWDDDKEQPGVGCVDWSGFFDMFRAHTLPMAGQTDEFHVRMLQVGVALPLGDTVGILRAERHGRMAKADVRVDRSAPSSPRVVVTTSNVASVALGERIIGAAPICAVEIDGTTVKAERRGTHVYLVKGAEGRWTDSGTDSDCSADAGKDAIPPCGAFKNAFTNRFVMVYGTHGTPEENQWAMARVRFDSEQWWYRGNGRAEVISDNSFVKMLDEGKVAGNAVLYGNEQSNAAAGRLCPGQAARVKKGEVSVGERGVNGDDLGVLAAGTFRCGAGGGSSPRHMFALVGGTGVVGMRATDRFTYLLSGVGIPDICVLRAGLWDHGVGGGGIECAAFLGGSLGLDGTEVVWNERLRDDAEKTGK